MRVLVTSRRALSAEIGSQELARRIAVSVACWTVRSGSNISWVTNCNGSNRYIGVSIVSAFGRLLGK